MVSRYQGGDGIAAIGETHGCNRSTVQRVLSEEGVYVLKERPGAWVLSDAQQREAVRRYEAGESARAIALSFGRSDAAAVRRALKARGVHKPRSFQGFTAEQEAEMVTRYCGRESVESLRRSLDCGRGPVVTVLKRHGDYQELRFQGFTPEERDRIVARYKAGIKPSQIAREFGCHQTTITAMLQRLGAWVNPTSLERVGARYTMDQKREMVARYESGDSIYKIAKEFDGIPQSIWSILRAAEVEFRDKAWRGGRVVASGGYTAVTADPDDPIESSMANVTGYVLEHRLVMARSLGRPLTRHETVHHINGDKQDNRLENLQLRKGNHGVGVRFACLDCGSHNVDAVPLAP
jgi:transposase-like protein